MLNIYLIINIVRLLDRYVFIIQLNENQNSLKNHQALYYQ